MLDVVSSQFYSQGSDAGLWCEVYSGSQSLNLRPALFLDRDGVIVEDTHYLGARRARAHAPGRRRSDRALQPARDSRGPGQQSIRHRAWVLRLERLSGGAGRAHRRAGPGRRAARRGLCLRASRRRRGSVQHCRSSVAQAQSGHDRRCSRADEIRSAGVPGSSATARPILRPAAPPGLPVEFLLHHATRPNAQPQWNCAANTSPSMSLPRSPMR